MKNLFFIAVFVLSVFSAVAYAENNAGKVDPYALYFEHCSLCHGIDGLGEGQLSSSIKYHGNTNLRLKIKTQTYEEIKSAIANGRDSQQLSLYMPPWQDELTDAQIDALTQLVLDIRSRRPDVRDKMLAAADLGQVADTMVGKVRYEQLCSKCHGKSGEGDGRMAKIIKSPPPANLTSSMLPDDYLSQIIKKGGVGVGRSPKMPPWEDTFSEAEILSLIAYLKTLRQTGQ